MSERHNIRLERIRGGFEIPSWDTLILNERAGTLTFFGPNERSFEVDAAFNGGDATGDRGTRVATASKDLGTRIFELRLELGARLAGTALWRRKGIGRDHDEVTEAAVQEDPGNPGSPDPSPDPLRR